MRLVGPGGEKVSGKWTGMIRLLWKGFLVPSGNQRFLNNTIRLVLVPLKLLSTPNSWRVLVNFWSLMRTSTGSRPVAMPQGRAASSSLIFPPRTFAHFEGDVAAGLQHPM